MFIYSGSCFSIYNFAAKSLSILNPSIVDLYFGLKYISLSASFKFNLFFKYSLDNLLYSPLISVKNLFGYSFIICTL